MQINKSLVTRRRRAAHVLVTCSFGIAVLGSEVASAVTNLAPYVTTGIEHDSNVFDVPSSMPPFALKGDDALGDTIERIVAGSTADFRTGQNDVGLDGEFRYFWYDHFTTVSHSEFTLGGHVEWHFGPVFDVYASYNFNRYMAPFAQTLVSQLEIDTDKTGLVTLRTLITPEWRLDLTPKEHDQTLPLPGYPDFSLHEKWASAAINYLGIARTTAGLGVDYVDGEYSHIVAATKYDQETVALTALYKVTGLSDFNGQLGYTQRNTEANPGGSLPFNGPGPIPPGFVGFAGAVGKTSSVTGRIFYDRQLTAKTGVSIGVFREVDSYVAGANAEIGTGGEIEVRWDPDVKFSVELNLRTEEDKFPGAVATQQAFNNRVDVVRNAQLQVKYFALDWLTIHPYFNYLVRTSNFAQASYSATTLGIDMTAKFLQ